MTFGEDPIGGLEWLSNGPVHLVVDRARREATLVVAVDCDVATVERVQPLLHEAAQADIAHLEVDLSKVRFADSSAVRLVDAAHRAIGAQEAQLTVKTSPTVSRILDLTTTATRFNIVRC